MKLRKCNYFRKLHDSLLAFRLSLNSVIIIMIIIGRDLPRKPVLPDN